MEKNKSSLTFEEWLYAVSYHDLTKVYKVAKTLGWKVMVHRLKERIITVAKRYT